MNNCPICNSVSLNKYGKRYDDRFAYQGLFELIKCADCGHIFLQAEFTSDQLRDLYTNYYPRKTYELDGFIPFEEANGLGAWFNGLKSSAFRWVPENVSVLDVGCGFGQSLAYHTARGCEVYGVEADENIRRVVEKFGFNVHVGLFDDKVYESNYFDYITMDQVIEHVSDPILALKGVVRVIKPGGVVVLSTPNANGWGARLFGKRWINWHTPYHLQFFSKRSIKFAAKEAGLELVEIKTITNSEWLLYQWLHMAAYPKPGESSKFWLPNSLGDIFFQKFGIKLLILIHRVKINHVLTRIFDSIGFGDNYVFVLKK